MNKIKIAAISVGGVVVFAHIGLLGYVFNRPKQPGTSDPYYQHSKRNSLFFI